MSTGLGLSEAVELIKHFEGYSSLPYQCSAKVWTIGYGTTRTAAGRPITPDTPAIDRDTAAQWLIADVLTTAGRVGKLITVPLTPNQYAALVSFAYNVGNGNLAASTLRQMLNRGEYQGAADEFPKWRRAGGVVVAGLVRRRAAERALYLS